MLVPMSGMSAVDVAEALGKWIGMFGAPDTIQTTKELRASKPLILYKSRPLFIGTRAGVYNRMIQ